jgi:peptide/nickel transport system permease protein
MSVVLSLETTGPMQLRALTSQDMYLAGSFLLLLSVLVVVGTLVSDILLAWVDPRIRLEE